MAKVLVNESSLTGIADAIRDKNGETTTYKPSEMAAAISAIKSAADPVIEALDITSNGTYTAADGVDGYSPIVVNVPQDGAPTDEELSMEAAQYLFSGGWGWFINKYGNRIKVYFNDNKVSESVFQNTGVEDLSMIHIISTSEDTCYSKNSMFQGNSYLKKLPTIENYLNIGIPTISNFFNGCLNLTSDELDGFLSKCNWFYKITGKINQFYGLGTQQCYSLRNINHYCEVINTQIGDNKFTSNNYGTGLAYMCSSLDEIKNIPVLKATNSTETGNRFSNSFFNASRLKDIIFSTDNGIPYVSNWKAQTIDLTNYVGYAGSNFILGYNSGITADKEVKDDATYQALKDDPDWYTTKVEYSRYNHDSAVNTINSLPDTSAYLASAGGTNTIKFKGASGSATDGGAINTLTEEEIAVATSRGWTVTLV